MENLARYIIRAFFSQERMVYIPAHDSPDGTAKVIYTSKDGKTSKTFDALDWLAQLVVHIPNRGEQMVRYYGFYSNRARGDRKKKGKDDEVPALMEPEVSSKELRRSWARLIQKIYNVDPLICPNVVGFFLDKQVAFCHTLTSRKQVLIPSHIPPTHIPIPNRIGTIPSSPQLNNDDLLIYDA